MRWRQLTRNANQVPLHSFRRIIPSVYGACDANNTLIQAPSIVLVKGSTPILFAPAQAGFKGSSKYVFIQLTDTRVMKFNVILNYDNGQSETVPVVRSNRYRNNDGRFFLELSDAFTGNLTNVSLWTDTITDGAVTARLCNVPITINQ